MLRFALAIASLGALLLGQSKLLRHPDAHGDRIVFTYAGDLWLAPLAGGTATRLTAAPGVELFAKFSPDGRWIAFTGQIGGDEQVCVVPADGGEIRQLTWYPANGPLPARWGYDNQVNGWTPDGTSVLFRSLRAAWTLTGGKLYTVPLPAVARRRGALPEPLPMPEAGSGAFSADGERIVYTPLFRDFRTWKRYQGGWAQEVFVFDPQSRTARNISNHVRADRDPMWIGDRVWFSSDRSGTNNLWSYDFASDSVHQETNGSTWDVRWPSAAGPQDHGIVFERGGTLHWLDTDTREERAIDIRVPDDGATRRPSRVDARPFVEDIALSPGGRRLAIAARGEILTVPKEHGDVRNLTNSVGAHDKHPSFSPDGATIAFVSDHSGEEQIWLVDHKGDTPPRQLTTDQAAMLYRPSWSPDGKWLAFGDKDGVLRLCEVATGVVTTIADEPRGQLHDHRWSPCSGHLVFSMTDTTDLSHIYIYTLGDGKRRRVSRPLANDSLPMFGPRGERLFFRGLRGFQPRLATTYEWDFAIDRAHGLYALALRQDVGPLFPPRSDEAVAADGEPPAAPTFDQPITIDFEGLADRVEPLPLPLDNYTSLTVADGHVLFTTRGGSYYGRGSDKPSALHAFSLAERKAEQLVENVGDYALSPDGKHIAIRTGGQFRIAPASLAGKQQHTVDVAGLYTDKVPADEHWQIFHEVWRRYRDFFYVANMHGHDWVALREQYAPLVTHVRHRSDLNYLIGEMIAELNVGHAYISGGDLGAPDRPDVALLGAELRFDEQASRYRVHEVLRGAADDPGYRSPASAIGVGLQVGEYLLAIDGVELTPETNPYRLLQHKADRSVRLTLNRRPSMAGARTVTIDPIRDEQRLRYHAFVEHNRHFTHEQSGGRVGYVHLPNMGADGIREFCRQYYAQRDRQALVIDDRYNGGGNVSQMIINRLSRELMMCTFGRTSGYRPYPSALFHGHMVCLLNETSASDGDIFPAMFRRAGLGQLIGKRSWGGIIGITNRGMLMDGGTVNVPEFGNTEPGGEWTIEGYGVDPDIEVDNDVASILAGRDPQLEKGIEVLLDKLRTDPRPLPTAPPPPVKTGR